MNALRVCAAVAIGAYLGATPFLRYSGFGHSAVAHSDHAPRHGGLLSMVGDHHIEMRRAGGLVEVYVTDARRTPVASARGSVAFDGGAPRDLRWESHRLVGEDAAGASSVDVAVILDDGAELKTTYEGTAAAD